MLLTDEIRTLQWLPPNNAKLPLFKEIDRILNLKSVDYDYKKLKEQIVVYKPTFLKRELGSGDGVLNWYSTKSWVELTQANWFSQTDGGGAGSLDIVPDEPSVFKLLEILLDKKVPIDYSYWTHLIEPFIGTSTIQEYLLEISPYKGEYKEWYQFNGPVYTYSFFLSEDLPRDYKRRLDAFIKLSRIFKNVESDIYTIQDDKNYSFGILDQTEYDECFLDGPSGPQLDGVFLLFTGIHIDGTPPYHNYFRYKYTGWTSEFLDTWTNPEFAYDMAKLDDTGDDYIWLRITNYYFPRLVQLLPGYFDDYTIDRWSGRWSNVKSWNKVDTRKLYSNLFFEKRSWDSVTNWKTDDLTWKGRRLANIYDYLEKTKGSSNVEYRLRQDIAEEELNYAVFDYQASRTTTIRTEITKETAKLDDTMFDEYYLDGPPDPGEFRNRGIAKVGYTIYELSTSKLAELKISKEEIEKYHWEESLYRPNVISQRKSYDLGVLSRIKTLPDRKLYTYDYEPLLADESKLDEGWFEVPKVYEYFYLTRGFTQVKLGYTLVQRTSEYVPKPTYDYDTNLYADESKLDQAQLDPEIPGLTSNHHYEEIKYTYKVDKKFYEYQLTPEEIEYLFNLYSDESQLDFAKLDPDENYN